MKRRKGFTIVELVIVIAVIAILAAVLIPTFSSVVEKATDSQFRQNIRNYLLEKTIEEYLGDSKPETASPQPDANDEPVFATISYSDGKEARQIKASELPSYDDIMSALARYSSAADVKYIQDFLTHFKPIIEDVKDPAVLDVKNKYIEVHAEYEWDVYLTSDGYIFMFSENTGNLLGSILIFTQSSTPIYTFYGMLTLLDLQGDLYQPLYTQWEDLHLNPVFESPKTYKSDDATVTLTINK